MEYISEIIIGALGFLGAVIGSFSGFKLTAYRVGELEKKVDMHNHFARRLPVAEEQIKEMERRIAALERGGV